MEKTSGIEQVEELMEFMNQQLWIGAINSEVTIYKYDDGRCYQDGAVCIVVEGTSQYIVNNYNVVPVEHIQLFNGQTIENVMGLW